MYLYKITTFDFKLISSLGEICQSLSGSNLSDECCFMTNSYSTPQNSETMYKEPSQSQLSDEENHPLASLYCRQWAICKKKKSTIISDST